MKEKILWVDDEIEHLQAHTIFLQTRGYDVVVANNGLDAVELCQGQTFDLILLDEMMPGISGLETLERIKEVQPQTPVVMVTKSEEEDIMAQFIGKKIAASRDSKRGDAAGLSAVFPGHFDADWRLQDL